MRLCLGIAVVALALPLAAQELPSAPSASQHEAQQKAFRAQMDAPPNVTDRLSADDKSQVFAQDSPFAFRAAAASAGMAPANSGAGALQGRDAATASPKTGGFVGKVVSSVLGIRGPGAPGSEQRTFRERVVGTLSKLADLDDEPNATQQPNYSQYLGMAVSNTVASAYTPLDGHGMRHAGGGFGARLGAGGFLPSVKRLFVGQKLLERQRDALTWRTGSMARSPDSVH